MFSFENGKGLICVLIFVGLLHFAAYMAFPFITFFHVLFVLFVIIIIIIYLSWSWATC